MDVDDRSATRLESRTGLGSSPSSDSFDEGGFTPGTLLQGRYRIVALLGRGGMGEVYRAQDLKLGQLVALKFLPQEVHRDAGRLERFLSEVRIARQIFTIMDLPLSFDTSAWYAARSAITIAMLVGLAGWAFYRSLGGRSPFGAALDA